MSDSRTKNAIRNIKFGVLNRFVTLVLPFITRTIIIYLLGVEYLGIGTLYSSILRFLSLSELGLSSAIVYAMYKPIAEDDTPSICALLKYYRKLYRIIGTVILALGTALLPFIPYLMDGSAPDGINAYILYYIYLINSVISYFFAGYKQSLLMAHQRKDISSNIATIVNIFVQFGEILILYITRNFYAYAFIPILGTILTNLINTYITNKIYPHFKCYGDVSIEFKNSIKKRISGLFGTKLNSIVVHSADVMVISAFLGLGMVGKYGNYYYIMNTVCGFIAILFSSITTGIGNKLVMDSLDANYKLFKKISFLNAWIVTFCSCCFLCLFEPFMEIWLGAEYQLGIVFVILFTIYFFIYELQRTILTFKDAAGLWHKDKYRPYISMLVNLVSNFILIKYIGIYGIVLSTIIAFFISLPWANHVLFKYLFKKSAMLNLLDMLKHTFIACVLCATTYGLCYLCPSGIFGLLMKATICFVLPNIIYLFMYTKYEDTSLRSILKSLFKNR